jgi:hypothetical protein
VPAAQIFNITLRQHHWYAGEDKTIHLRIVDADGDPVDVSAFSLRYRLMNRDTGVVMTTRTSALGEISVIDGLGTGDEVVISMPQPTSEDLGGKTWVHQLDRIDAGDEDVLTTGYVEIGEAYGWP